jgi:UrcA family protein
MEVIMTYKNVIASLCLFSAAISSSAFAYEEMETRRVSYADLDLMTKAGAATLDRRVERAIREVCGQASSRDIREMLREKQCRNDANRTVRPQLDTAFAAARVKAGAVQTASVQPTIRFSAN